MRRWAVIFQGAFLHLRVNMGCFKAAALSCKVLPLWQAFRYIRLIFIEQTYDVISHGTWAYYMDILHTKDHLNFMIYIPFYEHDIHTQPT